MKKVKDQALERLDDIITGSIRSYSQIFFSTSKFFGIILLVVSFFDLYAGIAGFLSVLTSNILATILGYSEFNIKQGSYGFNSLLVGLGIGLMFEPSFATYIIVFLSSGLTFIITIFLEGFLSKYYLPFLSIPFLFGMWLIILSSRSFSVLGISERGIYTLNELYKLGGKTLIDIFNWFDNLFHPLFIKTYLLSLAAIFFQNNLLAGFLIVIGLLLHSRIAFLLSLIGFSTAFLFYNFLGIEMTEYGYTYIGFNYILTSIALGGHFLVPNRYSFFTIVLLLPIVVLISLAFSQIFYIYQLPVYSLPFNIIVILFLYFLKLRPKRHKGLLEIIIQFNNPEKNLYYAQQATKRFKWLSFYPISLPFMGEWTVVQDEEGEYTHKGEWRFAWDFVILDSDGKQFANSGDFLEDYFCYNKNVVAPANGVVIDIVDGIDDNIIGQVNLLQNWGNTIVIKHSEYLYSQLSHLKKGSFKVKKGDFVKRGEILASCGNSGRSPYPHLHFQLQATPYVGSKTMDYPISHYIKRVKNGLKLYSYDKPKLNEKVSNINTTEIMTSAFNLIPGKKLYYSFNGKEEEWEVITDYYNNTYLYCKETNSYAYLYNDGVVHYFKNFVGKKDSALFYFYLALYQVPLGFYKNLELDDFLPVNVIKDSLKLFIYEFLAPFYSIMNVSYNLKFLSVDNEIMPEQIKLKSEINTFLLSKKIDTKPFVITITKKGISRIHSDNIDIQIINKKQNL